MTPPQSLSAFCLAIVLLSHPGLYSAGASAPRHLEPSPHARRLQWWREARFGMFIHWGPVSLKGTEIGWSRGAQIPIEEYDNLYRQFNPTNFNAREWARIAKAAGMKYLVFTSKHHDGFCMWDTRQTDFNIMHSPFGRDVLKELAAACRREGIRFATYHSVCDWHHPDFPLTSPGGRVKREVSDLDRYEQYLHAQVRELIQNYGPLLIMWFDVPQMFDRERGLRLEAWTRSLQPDIIINNRSGADGDYDTPEQRIGKYQDQRPWETCMTLCRQWAWKPNDEMKSLKECLQTLVRCAGGDGNLLFNVGPMPDGRIEPRQVERLKEMGAWLRRYGHTIYRTRGGPWKPTRTCASTRRGKRIFLHVFQWENSLKGSRLEPLNRVAPPHPALSPGGGEGGLRPGEGEVHGGSEQVTLPALPARVRQAKVLTGGRVMVSQTPTNWVIRWMPSAPPRPTRGAEQRLARPPAAMHPDDINTIIQLDLDRSALKLPAVSFPSPIKATASNVFRNMEDFAAESAFDGDPHTRWATDGGTKQAWVALEFPQPRRIGRVRIWEALGNRVQQFEFQYREAGPWQPLFGGTELGPNFSRSFTPVTARAVRLNILDATEGPTIWEIQVSDE